MPAKNPRLTITLPPALHATLRRLSELTGNSQSALIGELLEGSVPVLERTCVVLAAAKEAKDAIRGKLADDMEAAQAKIEQQLGLALGEFDQFTGDLLADVEQVKRKAARRAPGGMPRGARAGASAAQSTPLSNRGVRSTPKKAKKSTGTRG